MDAHSTQLGFDALLTDADTQNNARVFAAETAHLPDSLADGVALHTQQIKTHHAAMLACDFERALAIRAEAHLLARKLNGGAVGFLADRDAPGCVLARACAATHGDAPLWGQNGAFEVTVEACSIQITQHGMFGLGACHMTYPGFEARAVSTDAPFISDTGYRSFLGCHIAPEPGLTPPDVATRMIAHHIATALKGQLVRIAQASR